MMIMRQNPSFHNISCISVGPSAEAINNRHINPDISVPCDRPFDEGSKVITQPEEN